MQDDVEVFPSIALVILPHPQCEVAVMPLAPDAESIETRLDELAHVRWVFRHQCRVDGDHAVQRLPDLTRSVGSIGQ